MTGNNTQSDIIVINEPGTYKFANHMLDKASFLETVEGTSCYANTVSNVFSISYNKIEGNVKYYLETYVTIEGKVCRLVQDIYLANHNDLLHAGSELNTGAERAGIKCKYFVVNDSGSTHLHLSVHYNSSSPGNVNLLREIKIDAYLTCTYYPDAAGIVTIRASKAPQ